MQLYAPRTTRPSRRRQPGHSKRSQAQTATRDACPRRRRTKAQQYKELASDFTCTSGQMDREVVVDSQIRLVIRMIKENLFAEILLYGTVAPEILVFPEKGLRAEDIVQIIRETFGMGNEFRQMITPRTCLTQTMVIVKDGQGNEKDNLRLGRGSFLKPEDLVSKRQRPLRQSDAGISLASLPLNPITPRSRRRQCAATWRFRNSNNSM